MAKPAQRRKVITQCLDQSALPIYALDPNRRIIYCNSAVEGWLGVAEDQVLGQRVDYGAVPGETATPWSGLCPSPQAFQDTVTAGMVWTAGDSSSVRRHRTQTWRVAASAESPASVLVIVEDPTGHAASPVPDRVTKDPAILHQQLLADPPPSAAAARALPLVGKSPLIAQVRAQTQIASRFADRIMICGPTGSLHEELARFIHQGHRRSNSPSRLFPIDCSLLDAELLQTTIDALVRRSAESADERVATLLLLDVEELLPEAQMALTVLLRESTFELHTIATTSTELTSLDAFRADLRAALSTLTIHLPALTERLEDLPLLAQSIVEHTNLGAENQIGGLTSEAIDQLTNYAWSNNLEELWDIIVAAREQCQTTWIDSTDLPERIRLARDAERYPAAPPETIDLDGYLATIERELIARALRVADGNRAQAARLLGVSRARLLRRLSALRVDND